MAAEPPQKEQPRAEKPAERLLKLTPGVVLTLALAIVNLAAAVIPQVGVTYLAGAGTLGVGSVAVQRISPWWARVLSVCAALLSLAAGLSAIISLAVWVSPASAGLARFTQATAPYILYAAASIASLVASATRR